MIQNCIGSDTGFVADSSFEDHEVHKQIADTWEADNDKHDIDQEQDEAPKKYAAEEPGEQVGISRDGMCLSFFFVFFAHGLGYGVYYEPCGGCAWMA